jgi:hypothetical protein
MIRLGVGIWTTNPHFRGRAGCSLLGGDVDYVINLGFLD